MIKYFGIFNYQNPLFLAKGLIRAKQAKNEKSLNSKNDGLIDLRNVTKENKFLKMKTQIKQSTLLKKSSTLTSNKKVKKLKYKLLNKCFKDFQQELHK